MKWYRVSIQSTTFNKAVQQTKKSTSELRFMFKVFNRTDAKMYTLACYWILEVAAVVMLEMHATEKKKKKKKLMALGSA